MAIKDPKGYELKPWWPYVKNLQDQISGGGSGGGGVYELVLVMDTSTGDTTCNATQEDIIAASKAAGVDLRVESTSGEYIGSYHMVPTLVEMASDTELQTATFYNLILNQETENTLTVSSNVLRVIPRNGQANFDTDFMIEFNAESSSISQMQGANRIYVSMPNIRQN